jgi:tellurite resistance protein TerC
LIGNTHPMESDITLAIPISAKMLIAPWYHVLVQASLAIVAVLIGASVVASLIATRKPAS